MFLSYKIEEYFDWDEARDHFIPVKSIDEIDLNIYNLHIRNEIIAYFTTAMVEKLLNEG